MNQKVIDWCEKLKYSVKRHKKVLRWAIGGFLILLLIFLVWHYKKPRIAAQFELRATTADIFGVSPSTSFILKSSEDLSAGTVKRVLLFEPEIDFDVKKLGGGFFDLIFLKEVFAQDKNNVTNLENTFEIKPKENLEEDTIYQVSISDEGVADREYSWAFQVKAPFQVIGTHPRDKATHVPVNSGIEITLNRENFINPKELLLIEPEVEGTFEVYGNTIVFLPQRLDPTIVYTVTIKKGLRIQESDDVLNDDYVFRFETGAERYMGREPYFDFQNDFLEFVPDRKPVIKVFSDRISVNSLEFNVYRLPNIDEFLSSYQKSRKWFLGWTYYYCRDVGSIYQPGPESKILSFRPEIIEVGYEEFIEIPQILEQGYYLIGVKVGQIHRQAWLQITPLSHYFSITNDQSLIWIYDFQEKAPVGEAKIAFVEEEKRIDLGQTNQDGLNQFSTPGNLRDDTQKEVVDPQFFRIDHGSYPSVLIKIADSWGYYEKVSKGDLFWDYLSTDRYSYQMNDALRYWGIIKGRTQDLRQKKVTVGIYQGWWGPWYGGSLLEEDKPLLMQETVVSPFDTIEGKFQFRGLNPGFYNLVVTWGKEMISQTNFQVLTYTKPAYQIDVIPSKIAIFAGGPVDFDVQATFFDGTPVSNLKLKYSAYWQKPVSGELLLDESGRGTISYTPFYYEAQYDFWPRSFDISFSPKMAEEGEIWGSAHVLVFGPNIYLQSFQKKESGDTYRFTAKLNQIALENIQAADDGFQWEYIGDPVKDYPVLAKIVKVTYDKIETGQYYDYVNKVVRKEYRYEKREGVIEELGGITNSKGEWSFARTIPREENSIYRVDFLAKGSEGRKAESSAYVWYALYQGWKKFSVSLNIDGSSYEKEFSVGDKINLEFQILEGEIPANPKALFYRYQNSIDKAAVVSSLNYEEIFAKPFLPSVQYRAVIPSPYGFEESNSVIASFKESDNDLLIDVKQDKEVYRPGEQVNLVLTVRDRDNRPIVSEVNLAIVDEALFHLLPYDYTRDILKGFYENIWIWPLMGKSEYVLFPEAVVPGEGAEMGACFGKGTLILMADGSSKAIEDVRIGDQVLTWTDVDQGEFAKAVVQGISQHRAEEYLVINKSLKITPEHRLYLNGEWTPAGNAKIGDSLIDEKGESVTIYSIEKKKTLVSFYNIVVGRYHTYFAQGFWAHNEEKGGAPRAEFVDVAFYKTFQTDNRGRVEATFVLPDNITSWRATARAFAPEALKIGQDIKLIKASLPFFVEATLNKFYLVGDNSIMRVRAFGTNFEQGKSVEFEVKSDSLGLQEQKTSQTNTAYFSLNSLPEGEHEIIISAKQGEHQDAIVRKINVLKSYFRKGESSLYRLSDNLTNIEGNKDGWTRLLFVDLGKGRLYNTLWWDRFNSGIRIDQIVPKYLAEKFLAQYFEEPWQEEPLDLSGYHLENGGLGLFPYSSDDLALSAKLADLVPEFVFKVELKKYFWTPLNDKKADIHRISQALYGLAGLQEPVLVKINLVKENPDLNLEDKIYLALALVKLGDKENAREIYFQEIRGNLRFQAQEAWLHQEPDKTRQVKLTGLVAVLTSYLNLNDGRPLGEYIFNHNPEKDLDTLEEFLYIKSELTKPQKSRAGFEYKTSVRKEKVTLEEGRKYEIILSYEELQTIRFSDIEGEIALIGFYERAKDPQELTRNPELSLTRIYLVNNQPTSSFKEGDVVLVRLDPKIAPSAIDGQYQIIDYLPSGLKPITQIYRQGFPRETECNPIWYPSIVENNIVYFDIWKDFNKTQYCTNRTLNYYARVVSRGNYQANPAIIQSMKDLESLNLSSKDWLEIK